VTEFYIDPVNTAKPYPQELQNDTPMTIAPEIFYGIAYTTAYARTVHEEIRRDDLTGIYNRRWLLENLDTCIVETEGDCSLAFIDLDDLKKVNDEEGHQAGNLLLARAAACLRDSLGWGSQKGAAGQLAHAAVRLSGDEYVLLLPGVSKQEDLDQIMQHAIDDLQTVGIGASIGGRPHQPGESAVDLLKAVDILMYKQKQSRWQMKYDALPWPKRLAYRLGERALKYAGISIPRTHDVSEG
jgi:diguanylate cyclase (GGDEF)-like protein